MEMTANRFGGGWTSDKLAALKDYLQFYCLALSRQPYRLIYIDAFAGTGRCRIKSAAGGEKEIDGSARIALDCSPGFRDYKFIEPKRKHIRELEELKAAHPKGAQVSIAKGTAQDLLPMVLLGRDWSKFRGVLFLDPFGLQCDYGLLKQIAETKALDVFFLVSLSGLYRQAAVRESGIDEGKANKLTSFLGTTDWRDAIYSPPTQGDLFGEQPRERERGWQAILQFTTERLRGLFPYVADPVKLGSANNAPLFALYFAVANDSPQALALAKRVSTDILSKIR